LNRKVFLNYIVDPCIVEKELAYITEALDLNDREKKHWMY
jgi:hypothetical protein